MLALMPFGKEVVPTDRAGGCLHIILNILWVLICGIPIILTHLVFAILLGITIIGIPFASQHLKLAGLALAPFWERNQESFLVITFHHRPSCDYSPSDLEIPREKQLPK